MVAITRTTISGSAVAAPANRLSSSVAFGASGVQHLGVVRPGLANVCKVVAASNDEDRSSRKPQMVAALAAAGAALALNYAAPVWPAHAGPLDGDAKGESGSRGGSGGTGTQVGENASVRGAAASGTPGGEARASGSGVDINIDPLKTKIGDISPLKSTLHAPDANSTAMDVAADLKSKLPGGN